MTSDTARANPGNFANRDADQVSNIGRKGGEHSHQQDVRYMDADSLRRMADLRTTTTTSGAREKRSPTPSRNAGRSAGSGAQRRSRSQARSRSRSRSRARSED